MHTCEGAKGAGIRANGCGFCGKNFLDHCTDSCKVGDYSVCNDFEMCGRSGRGFHRACIVGQAKAFDMKSDPLEWTVPLTTTDDSVTEDEDEKEDDVDDDDDGIEDESFIAQVAWVCPACRVLMDVQEDDLLVVREARRKIERDAQLRTMYIKPQLPDMKRIPHLDLAGDSTTSLAAAVYVAWQQLSPQVIVDADETVRHNEKMISMYEGRNDYPLLHYRTPHN